MKRRKCAGKVEEQEEEMSWRNEVVGRISRQLGKGGDKTHVLPWFSWLPWRFCSGL
jgi:hypothetical protein